MNKKKFKRSCATALVAVMTVGAAAGYRVLCPGGAEQQAGESSTVAAADTMVTDWGLSFQTEGEAPAGNATAEELAKYNACYLGEEEKVIYLTFDAGYENGYTAEILDVLKKEKVPAAFFLVGTYIEANPDLVRRMVKEGHLVGNHTMNHPDMSAIADEAAFQAELSQVETIYREITGEEMKKFYRPPQGKFSIANLEMAKQLGYKTVFWSLAYVDWYVDQQPTREEALAKLLPRTHKGAVILLHSTSKTNAQVLQELITRWKADGYTFKSVEAMAR